MIIRAVEGRNRTVIYIFSDGRRLVRSGGTWQWRNNNPEAMKRGPRSRRLGAIGGAGGFAVFPDYKTGRDANRALLLSVYPGTTLYNLPTRYSPATDGNDVKRYRQLLHEFTGFDMKRTIRDLDAKEIETLLNAIQRIEGFEPGKEVELGSPKPILDVKRDKKNRPVRYLNEDLGWLSPTETMKGILEGAIDGVVAHRAGKSYVKTRPDGSFPNNIDAKGRN